MVAELRDANMSTVLIGRFNPLIFSPEWLRDNNVIGPDEARLARETGIEVMAPNVVSINLDGMKLLVEEPRFMLIIGDEPFVRAKDFPVTCFHLLRHTPVSAVGFNYNVTLVETDAEKWHRFGDTLAPKDKWADFLTGEHGKRRGGLRSITMDRNGSEGDQYAYIRVTVEAPEGIYLQTNIQVNHHFNLGDAQHPGNGGDAYRIIADRWDEAQQTAKSLTEQIKAIADAA